MYIELRWATLILIGLACWAVGVISIGAARGKECW